MTAVQTASHSANVGDKPPKRRKPFANAYWFPVAAIYALLVLPWSVMAQFGLVWAPAGLQTGLGHAHEMLFGFALAVVAGYILGPRTPKQLLALIGVWLLARIAYLGWPLSWWAALLNAIFVVSLAWLVAPTYLRTAKKWRNKSVAVIVLGLMITVLLFHGLYLAGQTHWLYPILLEAVLLLSALMFFMGGRMLAPALAGHLQSKKQFLKDRVQPRVEGSMLVLLALVLITNALPFDVLHPLTAILLFGCAFMTLVRMGRWRIWYCFDRVDLLALLLGYVWLVVGWGLIGLAFLSLLPLTPVLHAITIGALGTLTFSVMLRTRMHRCLKDPNAVPWAYLPILLMGVAALLRMLAEGSHLLVVAALCWSICYLWLFALLMYLGWREKYRPVMRKRKLKPAPAMLRQKNHAASNRR